MISKHTSRRACLGLLGGGAYAAAAARRVRAASPKRLVVCCDGTWNDAASETHIHWIAEHAMIGKTPSLPQMVKYFSGVGTDVGNKIKGGALGYGLSQNVRIAYSFIRDNWEPGDELFIFGFSRGAYTARSLCGFMHLVGWLDDPEWIDAAYLWYRLSRTPLDSLPGRLFVGPLGDIVRRHSKAEIDVTFLGVFDTVGALGVPWRAEDLAADLRTAAMLDKLGLAKLQGLLGTVGAFEDYIRRPIEGFHDTSLSDRVKNASHALAIDERRGPFLPTLWTSVPVTSNVEQAWFPGVHGDVGGNYHEAGGSGLSAVPLLWTLEKATAVGLELTPGAIDGVRSRADPLAPQHESLTEEWQVIFDVSPADVVTRPIGNAARASIDPDGKRFPQVQPPDNVYRTARQRVGNNIEIRWDKDGMPIKTVYNPGNLPPAL